MPEQSEQVEAHRIQDTPAARHTPGCTITETALEVTAYSLTTR